MHYHVFSLAILALASTSVATPARRDAATNEAGFTVAANSLIASYIPSSVIAALSPAIASAASAASVTGDPGSLLISALEASPRPSWLAGAVPAAYTNQISALENAIDALRPTPVGPVAVFSTTGVDSAGSSYTSLITATVSTVAVVQISTYVNSQGSTVTSTIASGQSLGTLSGSTVTYTTTGTNSEGTAFTSTGTTVIGVFQSAPLTLVPTTIVETTTNAQGSTYTTTVTTSTAVATGTSTSNMAPGPSGMARSAAGVLALVGLVVAL